MLVSKDFLWLVVIACVMASPIAWYISQQWLQDFAYRITIHWWIFAAAAIVSLMVAGLTVSFQAIKAALANPVDSLKNRVINIGLIKFSLSKIKFNYMQRVC